MQDGMVRAWQMMQLQLADCADTDSGEHFGLYCQAV
jgi:hypothetical protein